MQIPKQYPQQNELQNRSGFFGVTPLRQEFARVRRSPRTGPFGVPFSIPQSRSRNAHAHSIIPIPPPEFALSTTPSGAPSSAAPSSSPQASRRCRPTSAESLLAASFALSTRSTRTTIPHGEHDLGVVDARLACGASGRSTITIARWRRSPPTSPTRPSRPASSRSCSPTNTSGSPALRAQLPPPDADNPRFLRPPNRSRGACGPCQGPPNLPPSDRSADFAPRSFDAADGLIGCCLLQPQELAMPGKQAKVVSPLMLKRMLRKPHSPRTPPAIAP